MNKVQYSIQLWSPLIVLVCLVKLRVSTIMWHYF